MNITTVQEELEKLSTTEGGKVTTWDELLLWVWGENYRSHDMTVYIIIIRIFTETTYSPEWKNIHKEYSFIQTSSLRANIAIHR